ncbi:hypothetical protein TSOC_003833, partial [Tetrabaena socialis]
ILGNIGHVHELRRLLTMMVALDLINEHSYSVAFRGWARCNKFDMALSAFEEASGRDLGPVACSTLLTTCAKQRNMRLAWQLFDTMVAQGMTLNRYSYNCMAHMAALGGRVDDAVLIYNMMKAAAASTALTDEQKNDNRPDSYTYAALVQAAATGGRTDLLPSLFNEMVAAQRAAERAAGRPRRQQAGAAEGEGQMSQE